MDFNGHQLHLQAYHFSACKLTELQKLFDITSTFRDIQLRTRSFDSLKLL